MKEYKKMIVRGFNQFGGKHCQTAALKNILDYRGLHFSEEMLLGMGGGIGFIYWYMKRMPAPFIGCRNAKVDEFVLNICKQIGIEAEIFQTSSAKRAKEELIKLLKQGEPVYLFADMAYLPYFALPEDAHFGGHAIAVFGLDGSIRDSIKNCCQNMLNPPISNIGLSGLKKWASIVPRWPEQFKGMNSLVAFSTPLSISRSADLPDSWPLLRRIRELTIEKNRIFEEQESGALEKMEKINIELDDLIKKAVEELQERNTVPLLKRLNDVVQ